MILYSTTDNKFVKVEQPNLIWHWQNISSLVGFINRSCLPLINELKLEVSIENIVRWCSSGGLERMKEAFIKKNGGNNEFMETIVSEKFDEIVKNHPEFKEVANDWCENALLHLADDKSRVYADYNETMLYYSERLTDKKAIDIYNKLISICDTINSFLSPDYYDFSGEIIENLISWNEETGKYSPKLDSINDELLLEIANGSKGIRKMGQPCDNYRYEDGKQIAILPEWLAAYHERQKNLRKKREQEIKASFGL